MYRVVEAGTSEIIRILHDRMDLKRHLPSADDDSTNSRAESRNRPVVEEDYGEPEHKLGVVRTEARARGLSGPLPYDPIPEVERPILL